SCWRNNDKAKPQAASECRTSLFSKRFLGPFKEAAVPALQILFCNAVLGTSILDAEFSLQHLEHQLGFAPRGPHHSLYRLGYKSVRCEQLQRFLGGTRPVAR